MIVEPGFLDTIGSHTCWGTCVAMDVPCTCIAWRHFQVNGDKGAGQTDRVEVKGKETGLGCELG